VPRRPVEAARDAVREAHDLGADPAKATAQLDQDKHAYEQATLAREGLEQRVRRADDERANYLTENSPALLSELRPECEQVVADMRAHAEALLLADKRWRQLSAVVAGHLRAQNLTPHTNAPGVHGLEPVLSDLKRALQRDIVDPGPHWVQSHAARAERENVASMRRDKAAA
jgi:hypothetical protein